MSENFHWRDDALPDSWKLIGNFYWYVEMDVKASGTEVMNEAQAGGQTSMWSLGNNVGQSHDMSSYWKSSIRGPHTQF